ncbi:polyamine ABC transporter substrate-binding protein [Mycobacterium sp. KBS0706]|uniref:polyamine ABC transporter substrate-binding protein n=1 Tax=Mycobacterium sp. KBS0706 TaxID=2578109 RepID=UPI00110FA7C9|nr:polyamine ABC transporter substrate-binding protein [Mycobacterium sp. KBS0706]TSD88088.1 polyamine ABC transporter substrate-binding protein [Mycobacterium sp. KBS0706]
MKRLVQSLLATAALCAVAAPALAQEKVVNIYNWSDYIGETTLADFTKATGIKTVYDTYDGNEALEAKLLTGNSGYDVVVPTAQPFLSRQIKAKVYLELDKSKIPNWKNLDPALMKLVESADPGNKHAIIYQWGTVGVGYNVDQVKKRLGDTPPDSIAMVLDPENAKKLADCGITMLDSPTDVIPSVLNYLGLDPNSQKPEDLKKAEDALMKVRPYLKYLHSSQYINDLAGGNVCVSLGWSGDVNIAKTRADEAKNGVTIDYFIPKEGAQIWFDMAAIPKDAPHVDNAYAYINFLLEPKVMAGIDDFVGYGNAVLGAKELMNPDIANDPRIFPPEDVMKRLFAITEASSSYERLRTRTWTRFRTGQ